MSAEEGGNQTGNGTASAVPPRAASPYTLWLPVGYVLALALAFHAYTRWNRWKAAESGCQAASCVCARLAR